MKPKLLMISLDAMVGEDLEIMAQLPGFGEILSRASVVDQVITTYPSLTHPVHVSLLTGCYPDRHGIISNDYFLPGAPYAPWYEDYSLVREPMLPQLLMEQGRTCCSICWPLTIGMPAQWVLGRAWIHEHRGTEKEVIRRNSTPGLFDEVSEAVQTCWGREHYEESDMFCYLAGEYILEKYRPDATFIHFVLMDHIRHAYGVFSDKLKPAYQFLDQGIVRLLHALKKTGDLENTIICLTSDHGQIDVKRVVNLNRFFIDHGLIQLDHDGKLVDWNAYCHSGSLSAYIYVRESEHCSKEQVYELLKSRQVQLGIGEIMTPEETQDRYHLTGVYSFMVETDGCTSFSGSLTGELITCTDNQDYRTSVAGHGHQPEKGAKPAFVLCNPKATQRAHLSGGRVIDQAPTLAALLDVPMNGCDGRPIQELLR